MRNFIAVCAVLLFCCKPSAADFPAQASIYLQPADGDEINIGRVVFSPSGSSSSAFAVTLNNDVFTDHFLSMRPFRCLQGDTEWFCYLEYPYELRGIVTPDDLTDLEYQLLFIRKTPSEFGIDAWNGLYYKLVLEDDATLTGQLLEGDLNSLQSPPAEKYDRPVDLEEFIPASKSKRLFPTLKIR